MVVGQPGCGKSQLINTLVNLNEKGMIKNKEEIKKPVSSTVAVDILSQKVSINEKLNYKVSTKYKFN